MRAPIMWPQQEMKYWHKLRTIHCHQPSSHPRQYAHNGIAGIDEEIAHEEVEDLRECQVNGSKQRCTYQVGNEQKREWFVVADEFSRHFLKGNLPLFWLAQNMLPFHSRRWAQNRDGLTLCPSAGTKADPRHHSGGRTECRPTATPKEEPCHRRQAQTAAKLITPAGGLRAKGPNFIEATASISQQRASH